MTDSIIGKPLFVQLRCARNVYKADTLSESDPYVICALRANASTSSSIVAGSVLVQWPTVDDEHSPIWNCTKFIAKEVKAGQVLHFKMYDEDATSDDMLGEIHFPVEKYEPGKEYTMKIPFPGDKKHIQEVDIKIITAFPSVKKNVIVIRHGESMWNEAQSNTDLKTMVSRTDHPLTVRGAKQALFLSTEIQEALDKREQQQKEQKEEESSSSSATSSSASASSALNNFLDAPAIYVSPLCRATQTALLALYPLATRSSPEEAPEWLFKKNAREKRNYGGRDSSGTCFGKDYIPFLVKELDELSKSYNKALAKEPKSASAGESSSENSDNKNVSPLLEQEALEYDFVSEIAGAGSPDFAPLPRLAQILEKIDTFETKSKFWDDSRESGDDAARRIAELFFEQIMFDPRETIIVVGHSHFFRDFMKHYFSKKIQKAAASEGGYQGYSWEQYQTWKLMNAGTAHCEMDFSDIHSAWRNGKAASDDDMKCIQSLEFLFGTKLIA